MNPIDQLTAEIDRVIVRSLTDAETISAVTPKEWTAITEFAARNRGLPFGFDVVIELLDLLLDDLLTARRLDTVARRAVVTKTAELLVGDPRTYDRILGLWNRLIK